MHLSWNMSAMWDGTLGRVWRWNQASFSHMKDGFWHAASEDVIVCQGLLYPVLYAGLHPHKATTQKSSLQRKSAFSLSSATFLFSKLAIWLLEQHESLSQCNENEAALCDEEGVEEVWEGGGLLFIYICVCVEGFVGGHPSCQSCLAGINVLFVELTHRYNGRFVSVVRPRLPPSDSRTQCQRAENTPRCKHTLES